MRQIFLFCAAGMSTSLLVEKMKKAALEDGYECEISAHSLSSLQEGSMSPDIILLGPQVRHYLSDVKEQCPNVPVESIDMMAYGLMDGKKVIAQVKKILGD